MTNVKKILATAAATALGASLASAQAQYSLTDLGDFGGAFGAGAAGISDRGEVVGLAHSRDGWLAFTWTEGIMVALPRHPLATIGIQNNEATDVNESGQIAAKLGIIDAYFAVRIEPDRTVLDLGTLPGGDLSMSRGINEAGDVVGWSRSAESGLNTRAFVYREAVGEMVELPLPVDARTQLSHGAWAINDAGFVAGATHLTGVGVQERAIVWGPDNEIVAVIEGPSGRKRSEARDINNHNQVVGWYDGGGPWLGFMHDLTSGETARLGTLGGGPCVPEAVNDRGQIVGTDIYDLTSGARAWIWEDGAMTDLNDLLSPEVRRDYIFSSALDINERGQIVGIATRRSDGISRAVLLDPIDSCRADLDGDGELTFFDFLAFQNLFAAGDPQADFDGDGDLTIFDFLAFQNEFAAGCP